MTLLIAEGFEGVRDDSDLRLRGWVTNTKGFAGGIPSYSGVAGTALRLMSHTNPYTESANQPGVSGALDFGWKAPGITCHQLWTAGGFVLGFGARFNQNSPLLLSIVAQCSFCYDGVSNYWAGSQQGSTFSIVTSQDLVNWTVLSPPNQAAIQTAAGAVNVAQIGPGLIGQGALNTATTSVFSTSNPGSTWTTSTLTTAVTSLKMGQGNATTPLVVIGENTSTATNGGVWVGTPGTTLTKVSGLTFAAATLTGGGNVAGTSNRFLYGGDNSGFLLVGDSTLDLTQASSWNRITISGVTGFRGMMFHNNNWVALTFQGIYTTPNTGTSGTILMPTTGSTWTRRTTNDAIGYATNGTTAVVSQTAVNGIVTSPDGITWTAGVGILVEGDIAFNVIWDGARFVLPQISFGIVLTSTDGLHWNPIYSTEFPENTSASTSSVFGLYAATAINAVAGTFTFAGQAVGLVPAGVVSGSRSMVIGTQLGSTVAGTLSNTSNNGYHYYELVATPTATGNTFTYQLFVDTVALGSPTAATLFGTSTTDTTTQFVLNFPRAGVFTTIDDVILTQTDGIGLSGRLGGINIVDLEPVSDVQAQFAKSGAQASNAVAVSALSAYNATGFVSSSVAGNKDIYNLGSVHAGFSIKALVVEGAFSATTTTATVEVGIRSSTAEADSAATTVTAGAGNVFVQKIVDVDPNTSAPWTTAAAATAKATITQVS